MAGKEIVWLVCEEEVVAMESLVATVGCSSLPSPLLAGLEPGVTFESPELTGSLPRAAQHIYR
jgi:hypothetical protein